MPTYTYACDQCDHTFDQIHRMDDRRIPCDEPCPNCNATNSVDVRLGAPKIVSGTTSTLRKAGSGWGDVLKKVKSGSGMNNTIND